MESAIAATGIEVVQRQARRRPQIKENFLASIFRKIGSKILYIYTVSQAILLRFKFKKTIELYSGPKS